MEKILIKDESYGGERPLYARHDLKLENVKILPGESALKHTARVEAHKCEFSGKYPFWHSEDIQVSDCIFHEGARAAIWYVKNFSMTDTLVEAPKMFREMDGLCLRNVKFPNALETCWNCADVQIRDAEIDKADYIFMNNRDLEIENLHLNGNYSFQYVKNAVIRNSVLNTKDAFWHSEGVTVYDSVLNGEYLGWHSRNLRLVNCKIYGTQPLCYAHDLVMENCTMGDDADLAFEYSTLDARITGHVVSVKNPDGGRITAGSIGEIIIDENSRHPGECKIETAG